MIVEKEVCCPKCKAWIATAYCEEDKLVRLLTSSDFIEIDSPCRCCKDEENNNE